MNRAYENKLLNDIWWTCKLDRFREFRRLIETNDLSPDILQDVRDVVGRNEPREDDVLGNITYWGRFHFLEYLVNERGFTRDHIRRQKNSALVHACFRGNLQIVRYLVETIGLTKKDAMSRGNEPLRHAAFFGHMDVFRYIIEKLQFTASDARHGCVWTACYMGQVDIVMYLVKNVGLTLEDLRDGDYPATRQAILSGNRDLIRFLKSIGMNKDDILLKKGPQWYDATPFEVAAARGYVKLLKFLIKTFNITYIDLDNSVGNSPFRSPIIRAARWGSYPLSCLSVTFIFLEKEVYTFKPYLMGLVDRAINSKELSGRSGEINHIKKMFGLA